ncbi:MAG TPA: GntR family transcriptional regulator, partial [Devosia sp.]|nr:GntR family transcriptional regulator [Devosia sp.]
MSDVTQLAPIEPWMLKSLREHVHELLRKAILSGQLKAGEKLNERRLAAELGTSTTPLKEAFRQLEAEGLVRTEARRGSYVIFDARQAEEMMLARAAIESMIARQAAKHIAPRSVALLGKTLEQMQEALARADLQGLIA